MKTFIFGLTLMLLLVSCKKYIVEEPIIYTIDGTCYVDIKTKQGNLRTNVNDHFIFTENVRHNDTVQVFLLSDYYLPCKLKIQLGSKILYEGTPSPKDGIIYINAVLDKEYFRLKSVRSWKDKTAYNNAPKK